LQAGTNDNSGALFLVIAAATSERRRGASRPSAIITSATRTLTGTNTCTRRRPQSGAGRRHRRSVRGGGFIRYRDPPRRSSVHAPLAYRIGGSFFLLCDEETLRQSRILPELPGSLDPRVIPWNHDRAVSS